MNDPMTNELKHYEDTACPTCGSCSGLFTANSMNCLCEALGIALPGNGTVPAVYSERIRLAKHAGMKVMELLERGVCMRDIVNAAAVHNAMECDMAFGGSTNTVLHLTAIAREEGHPITMDDWDAASARTPHLVKLQPSGPAPAQRPVRGRRRAVVMPSWRARAARPQRRDVHGADGRLSGVVHDCRPTARCAVRTTTVLAGGRASRCCTATSRLTARLKKSAVDPSMMKHTGPARCSTARRRPARPSTPVRSSRATSWSFATRAPKAAGHARCSHAHVVHFGDGPVHTSRAHHRRALLGRDEGPGCGAREPRGCGRRPHRALGEGDPVTVDIEGGALTRVSDAESRRRRRFAFPRRSTIMACSRNTRSRLIGEQGAYVS